MYIILNSLPATTATPYSLHTFLMVGICFKTSCLCAMWLVGVLMLFQIAGFVLHRKYGSQFMKILDVIISRCFLLALKEQGNKMQAEAVNTELSERQNLPRKTRRAVPQSVSTLLICWSLIVYFYWLCCLSLIVSKYAYFLSFFPQW